MSNPTRCDGQPLQTIYRATPWRPLDIAPPATAGLSPALTGCADVPFTPATTVATSTSEPDAPTGLDVDIASPQNLDDPDGLAAAHLKDVTVELPDGLTINPGSANGLRPAPTGSLVLAGDAPIACPAGIEDRRRGGQDAGARRRDRGWRVPAHAGLRRSGVGRHVPPGPGGARPRARDPDQAARQRPSGCRHRQVDGLVPQQPAVAGGLDQGSAEVRAAGAAGDLAGLRDLDGQHTSGLLGWTRPCPAEPTGREVHPGPRRLRTVDQRGRIEPCRRGVLTVLGGDHQAGRQRRR